MTQLTFKAHRCFAFIKESNLIESITRLPTKKELDATEAFLDKKEATLDNLKSLQAVYAPGYPIRDKTGMDVRVGGYYPPLGSRFIERDLESILGRANEEMAPNGVFHRAYCIHMLFELLHPFLDGNGRTGRALWAWVINNHGLDPFALPFLQRFYYSALAFHSNDEGAFSGRSFESWSPTTN